MFWILIKSHNRLSFDLFACLIAFRLTDMTNGFNYLNAEGLSCTFMVMVILMIGYCVGEYD